jgi:hypothetical protein
LLNYSWYQTGIAIMLTLTVTLTLLITKMHFYDLISITLIVFFAIVTIYACYFFEMKMKAYFIQMH